MKVVDFVPHIIIASSLINDNHTRREVEMVMVHRALETLVQVIEKSTYVFFSFGVLHFLNESY